MYGFNRCRKRQFQGPTVILIAIHRLKPPVELLIQIWPNLRLPMKNNHMLPLQVITVIFRYRIFLYLTLFTWFSVPSNTVNQEDHRCIRTWTLSIFIPSSCHKKWQSHGTSGTVTLTFFTVALSVRIIFRQLSTDRWWYKLSLAPLFLNKKANSL